MSRKYGRWAVRMVIALALTAGEVLANNLTVSNVMVTGRDDTTAYVQFDISWENSWRYPNVNHDAAWMFFKVQRSGQTDWQHVTLEGTGTNPEDYSKGTGTPTEMIVPTDRVGMFLRRAEAGVGPISAQKVKVVWNIASNNLVKTDKVRVQAFGVEMVYVAAGSFKVGSGGAEKNRFYAGGTVNDPFAITNEDAITVADSVGNLYYRTDGGGQPGDRGSPIPAAFPKGYAAFYCMKYEITQGQYVDFLNALTRDQQATRCTTNLNNYMSNIAGGGSATIQYRNTIRLTIDPEGTLPRTYTTTRRDRACNYLTLWDIDALADWSGLRPMTELEFEKACRGPASPVPDEYAWSNATIMDNVTRVLSEAEEEDGKETVMNDTSRGGCNYGNKAHTGGNGGSGPLRAGIFATSGATRAQAGASYWGIMELSGNLVERTVTVGHANGRKFTGLHGDGILTSTGEADYIALNWLSAYAIGFRGGDWYSGGNALCVSDRQDAANARAGQLNTDGGRAVRSAPSGVER